MKITSINQVNEGMDLFIDDPYGTAIKMSIEKMDFDKDQIFINKYDLFASNEKLFFSEMEIEINQLKDVIDYENAHSFGIFTSLKELQDESSIINKDYVNNVLSMNKDELLIWALEQAEKFGSLEEYSNYEVAEAARLAKKNILQN